MFFRDDLKVSKVGQGDLVFGVQWGFVSGSAHARLQVSVCSGYNFAATIWPSIGFLHFDARGVGKVVKLVMNLSFDRPITMVDGTYIANLVTIGQ